MLALNSFIFWKTAKPAQFLAKKVSIFGFGIIAEFVDKLTQQSRRVEDFFLDARPKN